MRVSELRPADTAFSNQCSDAGQRDVKTHGLRCLRAEETGLYLASAAWLSRDTQHKNSGRRGLSGEIELQELEEQCAIGDGESGLEGAAVPAPSVELHVHGNAGKIESTAAGARNQMVEHGAENKQKRLHVIDRVVELDNLFEHKGWLFGNHEVLGLATCKLPQPLADLTKANDKIEARQCCELTERPQTPERESLRLLRCERECGERKRSEERRRRVLRTNGEAFGGSSRETHRGGQIAAESAASLDADALQNLQQTAADRLGSAKEALGAADVQHKDKRAGICFKLLRLLPPLYLNSGCERTGQTKHGLLCGILLSFGPVKDGEVSKAVEFAAPHAALHAESASQPVGAQDLFERGRAFEHHDRQCSKRGSGPKHGLRSDLRYVHT